MFLYSGFLIVVGVLKVQVNVLLVLARLNFLSKMQKLSQIGAGWVFKKVLSKEVFIVFRVLIGLLRI